MTKEGFWSFCDLRNSNNVIHRVIKDLECSSLDFEVEKWSKQLEF